MKLSLATMVAIAAADDKKVNINFEIFEFFRTDLNHLEFFWIFMVSMEFFWFLMISDDFN